MQTTIDEKKLNYTVKQLYENQYNCFLVDNNNTKHNIIIEKQGNYGVVNITQFCYATKTDMHSWKRNSSTIKLVKTIANKTNKTEDDLIKIFKQQKNQNAYTHIDLRLLFHFAKWCDNKIKYSFSCYNQITKWLIELELSHIEQESREYELESKNMKLETKKKEKDTKTKSIKIKLINSLDTEKQKLNNLINNEDEEKDEEKDEEYEEYEIKDELSTLEKQKINNLIYDEEEYEIKDEDSYKIKNENIKTELQNEKNIILGITNYINELDEKSQKLFHHIMKCYNGRFYRHKRDLVKNEIHNFEKGSCVYILQNYNIKNHLKIGYSSDITNRFVYYLTSSPIFSQTMVYICYTKHALEIERIIKLIYRNQRHKSSEWIENITKEDLIKEIQNLIKTLKINEHEYKEILNIEEKYNKIMNNELSQTEIDIINNPTINNNILKCIRKHMNEEGKHLCTVCNKYKDRSEYMFSSKYSNGSSNQCKDCIKNKSEIRKLNKEKNNEDNIILIEEDELKINQVIDNNQVSENRDIQVTNEDNNQLSENEDIQVKKLENINKTESFCSTCNLMLSKENFPKRLNRTNGGVDYSCKKCSHKKRSPGIYTFKCMGCIKNYPSKDNMTRHIKSSHKHIESPDTYFLYKCSYCNDEFNTKEEILKHIEIKHKENSQT
jgi:hypothetical protein